MTLHFAYGSNMSRSIMRRHAPLAQAIGVAALAGYRFLITADGYASVIPERAQTVHGVLWRLTPRDLIGLDRWENIAGGLYRKAILPVRCAGRRSQALVYLARPGGEGRPKQGYMELVIAAARERGLPEPYVRSLAAWTPGSSRGPRRLDLGEAV